MTPAIWIPYCGVAPAAGDWRWNLDPVLIAVLVTTALVVGWRMNGRERLLGFGAVLALAVSFVSPLCALSSALFTARTVHHVILVALAAPLIAWSLPRTRAGSLSVATGVQAVVLWAWHAPDLYAAALSHDGIYWLMQASLLATSVWFWAGVRTASGPSAVGHLLVAMVAMGLLGALITFARQPLYAPHLLTTGSWGLTPLEDQQAAGLIMWAPAAAVYLIAALIVLGRWIGPDRSAEARPA